MRKRNNAAGRCDKCHMSDCALKYSLALGNGPRGRFRFSGAWLPIEINSSVKLGNVFGFAIEIGHDLILKTKIYTFIIGQSFIANAP